MSTDHKCYVGPYLSINNTPIERKVSYITCPNEKCKLHKVADWDGKFCPQCGTKLEIVGSMVKAPMSWSDGPENELVDVFYEPFAEGLPFAGDKHKQSIILIPNDNPIERETRFEDSAEIELTGATIKAEIKTFSEYFGHPIFLIKEKFGAENVKVKWGVVSYWS